MFKRLVVFLCALLCAGFPALGQRRPVLPQIKLPHPYYYRELYLPQLTSGPSSLAWAPDSKELVFSMAGSLWRQKMDSREAVQLTDGPGYDYQPDWSPDGKSVIYTSYQKDAMELWLVDTTSGKTTQLTTSGAVNLEPRWSPDGKKIVFVSTQFNGRFHIFRADFSGGKLENVVRLTGESKSDLPRYYYSAYNTEINPVWTRDSKEILFVSNRGHIHGTGGFWRMRAEPGAEAREIHYEETNWKARPDFSPDGSRMVYSSYLGRQWHNLWVMPANGGDAFPISYGNWDETCVRWSPDGGQLAFISNRDGGTKIVVQEAVGGMRYEMATEIRKYLYPRKTLTIWAKSETDSDVPARISLTDSAGRSYAPDDAWIYADDGFDRSERAFERHYFQGGGEVSVPAGPITIEVSRGYGYKPERLIVDSSKVQSDIEIKLKKLGRIDPGEGEWVGSDLHVHQNYGGTYRNDRATLIKQAEAEGLDIVNNLVVNKEQRFPDLIRAAEPDTPTDPETLVIAGQEFHTSYWGHRGLLNMKDRLLLPGYAGYPNTAAASLFPMNADVYDMAHDLGAIVGAVHPFDEEPDPFANPPQKMTDELPVDVALGKLDYLEVVGFSDHKATAAVWYRLLNLGFHIPAGAGTDATANYAAPIRGMVGMDRVYAWVPAWPLTLGMWMNGLRHGHTFATNGPLINFTLGKEMVGNELKLPGPGDAVSFTAHLRSVVPMDHLEIVCNGKVAKNLPLDGKRDAADFTGAIPVPESGWCVLRTWSEKPEYPVMDSYAYATTSPVYITVGNKKPNSPDDANYFAAWIQRTIEVTEKYPDWNSAAEKDLVLRRLHEAKKVYEDLEQK
ncbi:MAG: CehA/McbA family metallohydrolase [Acidobacteria bacterium]|nr:CehA/McbA family metallohydrolase [Acidobacteriota bacterium]MBS1864797.1 CehA/McbA family metallohydrolase [Acidobacteriota bacterium]